jgi:hypothetical protein
MLTSASTIRRWRKSNRKDPRKRARWIVEDYRKSDKKFGRDNDLDVPYVQKVIEAGCSYCGAPACNTKIGLDRIDNTIGHMKSNVVAACVRCNLIRRDMPHTAWMAIVPSVRLARENGLFGDWMSFSHGA